MADLLVKFQTTISPIFQLQQTIQADVVAHQQKTGFLILILLVILTSLIAAISLLINMSVGRPIAKLQNGIQIIGSGNLDHKVGTPAKDEIGQLSRAFDKMTNDLKKTTTSIVDLNIEITERKQAEEASKESEEKYRNILENIEEGYFEVSLAGNFTFFNDSLVKILGYLKDELMGMNSRQYTDEENAKKVYQTFNTVYTSGKPDKGFDWEIIRKDSTKRTVAASVSLRRDTEGKLVGFREIGRAHV